jgi:hypothetical protein
MFPLQSWLRRQFPTRPQNRPAARLRLDPLEDRSVPTVFTVTTTADLGLGSLRQAITDSNTNPGADTINFAIGTGVQTILLNSDLPAITDTVLIDGTTQTGFAGSPLVELTNASGSVTKGLFVAAGAAGSTISGLSITNMINPSPDANGTGLWVEATNVTVTGNYLGLDPSGSAKGNQANGLLLINGATGTTVSGNVISGNGFSGVNIINSPSNVFHGNRIGTNPAGTVAIPNSGDGAGIVIQLNSPGNTIGGPAAADRNVISGNNQPGVWLLGGGVSGTMVQGNYVGIDATGMADVGNITNGVLVQTAGAGNVISGNVISGNDFAGVNVIATNGVTIRGNRIGTNAAGTTAVPNTGGGAGVVVQNASATMIGGSAVGDGNLIAGNGQPGIWLLAGTTGSVVQGNDIGIAGLGNLTYGVLVQLGASNNLIGGTAAGAGNRITANGSAGVAIFDGVGNVVRGNSIFANGGLGIDLGGDGPTPNDPGDTDGFQNFPTITFVDASASSVTIAGSLNSRPNEAFTIDFYANPASTPVGAGEGRSYLGSTTVTTGPGGSGSFSVTLPVGVASGAVITATATDGSTSEFSSGQVATSPVANAGPDQTVDEGSPVSFDGTGSTDPAGGGLTYSWNFGDSSTGSGPTPTHTYANNGTYTVILLVQDAFGAESSDTAMVTVNNVAPTPFIDSVSSPLLEGTAITVTGHATDPGVNDTVTLSWAVFKNGGPTAYATGGGASFVFTPDDNGSFQIVLTATDKDGGVNKTQTTVAVANVAPQDVDAGPDQTVSAGTTVNLSGSFTDPGVLDTHTFAWTVAASNGQVVPGGSGQSFSFVPSAAGTYTVTFTVTDNDGGSGSDQVVITVTSGTLTATIAGDDNGKQGEALSFTGSASDAGASLAWSVTRNGSPVDLTGYDTTHAAFSFIPTEPGTYTVKLTATSGSNTATATKTVPVTAPSGFSLQPGGRLVIRGTNDSDFILIEKGCGSGGVKVRLNSHCAWFTGVTEIDVFANNGNDVVWTDADVTQPLFAFGGRGDDVLVGGSGNNVLVGGKGDDVLVGRGARDILIGGTGSDVLIGGGSGDILIGGSTAYDGNLAALGLIRNEWRSGHSLADRVANLSGTGTTGLNGPAVLTANGPNATVFADHERDELCGGCGTDWFFLDTGEHPDHACSMTTLESQIAIYVG